MTDQLDVIVVGAGPVGLYISYLMSRYGHSVYCLDTKEGPTNQSRAVAITSRTMEILESKGLAGEFTHDAFIPAGGRVYSRGSMLGQLSSAGDSPFAHMTVVVQNRTETIFSNLLKDYKNCSLNWETELLSYTQDKDQVTAIVLDKRTGQERTIRSKYIIGADGSHSKVRKGNSEFTYEGSVINTKFFLADLEIRGEGFENLRNRSNIFVLNTGIMGMIPLQTCLDNGAPVFRIFSNLESFSRQDKGSNQPSHGISQAEKPPSLEFLQEFIDQAVAPFKLELSNIIWSSYFKINERLANNYIDKRVILVGDSAHCHSPSGGQGMNLGLQDADNLAWKLSYVLKGLAAKPEELLESYHTERKRQAKKTLEATGNATKNSIPSGYLTRVLREMFLKTIFWIPSLSNYFFKVTMQQFVAITGDESSILGSSCKGTIKAGVFLPNTGAVRRQTYNARGGQLQRFNLREIMASSNKFSVFFVGTAPSAYDPNIDLMESFWKQARHYPVKRYIIGSTWHTNFYRSPSFVLDDEKEESETSFYAEESAEPSNSITRKVGLESMFPKYFSGPIPSVLLFVRPDNYVAQSTVIYNQNDLDKALGYLDTLFVSN